MLMSFSKIDVRNKWFKIWYFSLNLVAFATTKTKSNKKKKKIYLHAIKNIKINNWMIF